jgi:hypothetical protein
VTKKLRLCLELNEESVSAAVTAFIKCKVDWLAMRNNYNCDTRTDVQQYLSQNAKGTFLWVALVCQELADISEWGLDAEAMSRIFPQGLDSIYNRMLDQICSSRHAKLCKSILAVVMAVRRPITLDELTSFVDMPLRSAGNYKVLQEIIGHCGSFLNLRERTISVVHQSAKDFLVQKAYDKTFPTGIEDVHHTIFSRSLQVMSKILRRDIYGLKTLGISINEVKQPDPDPLSAARYSCVYWVDHLFDCDPDKNALDDFKDNGSVDNFLCRNYLYWLEALSLYRSMSEGMLSIAKLEAFVQVIIELV